MFFSKLKNPFTFLHVEEWPIQPGLSWASHDITSFVFCTLQHETWTQPSANFTIYLLLRQIFLVSQSSTLEELAQLKNNSSH